MFTTLKLLLAAFVSLGLISTAEVDPSTPGAAVGAESEPLPIPRTGASRTSDELDEVVQEYCVRCHSERRLRGNFSLEGFSVGSAPSEADVAERMIRKLRAGMMPPPDADRPDGDTLRVLAATLEQVVDEAWAESPNPGNRSFQRLNRAEYSRAIEGLLDLEIDAGDYLPLDMKSANFDNVADAQLLSPTLMTAYLQAADEVSRLAVGVPDAEPRSVTYTNSGYASQWERVPGAPRGTRGGVSVVHNFPADGFYQFELWFEHTTTGEFFGDVTPGEQLEISIDGERAALLDVDRWMHTSDPNGASQEAPEIFVRAGPHRVTAAFLKVTDGPVEDLLSPHEWSLVDRKIGTGGYGVTAWAHLKDLAILGPTKTTGVSQTPSRRAIFTCRPTAPDEERPCAGEIVARLASEAFRRPVGEAGVEAYMALYDQGAEQDGFERGIRNALQGILASPEFVFRLEEGPGPEVQPGESYRISDFDLASRLSFFLWGRPPDDGLRSLAEEGALSDPAVLEEQVFRMLADPRAEALGSRFAAQWLRLEDLEKVRPDRLLFPDYHQQLSEAMLEETRLFFNHLVREDRGALELFTADYSFMNERLARHYGIPGVSGDDFRRVEYPSAYRRGLLGHGSILTLTSHADRTSPVLRGKWVMEVILGTPPPPPPPNVPTLEESTEESQDGRFLTTGERLALHRANPTCNSCHRFIDPIGVALDNFDVTGRWRIRENGIPVDASTVFYDGTPMQSPGELTGLLLERKESILRNVTENLMTYALGRRVEYYDMPSIRTIVREASDRDYALSSLILGVVESPAFQTRRAPSTQQEQVEH